MDVIDNFSEMIALNKTLNLLRFGNTCGEIQEMIFSPYIVSIHLKLIEELKKEYSKINVEIPDDFGYIEDQLPYFNAIIGHVRSLPDWNSQDGGSRKEIIELIIKPYKIKDISLQYLIDYKT